MPVPTTIADLSTTAASNGPASTETISTGDDYIRALGSIIKRVATGADALTTPQINDSDSSHQYVFASSNLSADRTVTLPLLTGNDEFVFKDHTQTLTGKTLTSPTINGGTVADLTSLTVDGATTLGDAATDTVTITGKTLHTTRTTSPDYDEASASLCLISSYQHPSSAIATIAANNTYAYIGFRDGSTVNKFSIGANANVNGISYQMQSETTSATTSDMYAMAGYLFNKGLGSSKAIYARAVSDVAVGAAGATSAIVAGISGSTNQIFSVGVELAIDSVGFYSPSTGGAAPTHAFRVYPQTGVVHTVGWGLYFAKDLNCVNAFVTAAAGGAGDFLRLYSSAGEAGGVELFTVNASGIIDTCAGVITSGDITLTGAGKGVIFEGTTADAFETTLLAGEPTADQTVTIPNATTTLAGLAVAQTFTANQTINADLAVNGASTLTKTSAGALVDVATIINASGSASTEVGIFLAPFTSAIRGTRVSARNDGSNNCSLHFYTGAGVNIIERGKLDHLGNLTANYSTGGVGYSTGAGGAATQITSRTTGVTLSRPSGSITLVSAAGSTSWQTFTVTNTIIAATDTVVVCQKSGADLNEIHVTAVAAGSFNISFRTTGGTTVEQPVFNFTIIRGATA